MTRIIPIEIGEYYHIYHRGNYKQMIFLDTRDYIRFLFTIIYFQSPISFNRIGEYVRNFERYGTFGVDRGTTQKVIQQRYVELTCFGFMPNHFHTELKEKEEGGIAKYMGRVLNSYTKYFNTKYEKQGHLFQGPFKNKHVNDNEYLLHLSAYIYRNPRELEGWIGQEENYPWSSYQDYTKENRWGDLLKVDLILDQFKNKSEYKDFLDTSSTKDYE